MATIAESFDDHWELDPMTGCHVWQRACKGKEVATGGGYGCLRVNGKAHGAHRFAWERTYGDIPNGLQIMHTCHNTKCVNIQHMELGTNDENQEMRAKAGRYQNRLEPEDIQEMRRCYAAGELQRELAARFNLHQGCVSHIVNRGYWKHV